MAEEKLCPCHKTKVRDDKEYKDLLNRLNRIEGQIRGIKGMVERCVLPGYIDTGSCSKCRIK